MRAILRIFIVGWIFFSFPARALQIPPVPSTFVNDWGGFLSPEAKNSLENTLINFEIQTSNQVVIATFDSLEGENLEDFSVRLAQAWKIWHGDRHNGILLILFKKERSIRIEVGYGLEGALPDALAFNIIQTRIVPAFQKGDFDGGIKAGIDAILAATTGEYESAPVNRHPPFDPRLFLGFLIAAVLAGIADIIRYRTYLRSHKDYSYRFSFGEWFIRFAILWFIINMFFRIMASMAHSSGRSRNSGGSSIGGGSGFGFGGGGASGRW